MLTNIHKNCMGTISFDAKFPGMRKPQDFIVYPMKEAADMVRIQSDTRIGSVDLGTGAVFMSKPHASGAYFVHLAEAVRVAQLSAESLFMLKSHIFSTASGKAGSRCVYSDNSGALEVFNAV